MPSIHLTHAKWTLGARQMDTWRVHRMAALKANPLCVGEETVLCGCHIDLSNWVRSLKTPPKFADAFRVLVDGSVFSFDYLLDSQPSNLPVKGNQGLNLNSGCRYCTINSAYRAVKVRLPCGKYNMSPWCSSYDKIMCRIFPRREGSGPRVKHTVKHTVRFHGILTRCLLRTTRQGCP